MIKLLRSILGLADSLPPASTQTAAPTVTSASVQTSHPTASYRRAQSYISHSPDGQASWLNVPELDFVGNYAISQNGEFILGWGHRKYEYKIVLIAGSCLLWSQSVPACWKGFVSNVGTSAILYESPQTKNFQRVVLALGRDGSTVFEQRFEKPVCSLALSPDGSLLAFNTSVVGDPDQAQSVFLIWLTKDARLLFKTEFVDAAHIESVRFEKEVFIIQADGFSFEFTANGELLNALDADRYFARLADNKADTKTLYRLADRRVSRAVGSLSQPEQEFVEWAASRAVEYSMSDKRNGAKAARLLGELALAKGSNAVAKNWLTKALSMDDKCGVKKLLQRLG